MTRHDNDSCLPAAATVTVPLGSESATGRLGLNCDLASRCSARRLGPSEWFKFIVV